MLRILVVDDDVVDRNIVGRELNKIKFPKEIKEIGTLAGTCEIDPNDYDMAFVDLMLTPGCGIEVAFSLKTRNPKLYIIILTGLQEFKSVAAAKALGFDHYLIKPPTAEMLQNVISSYLKDH